MSIPGSYAFIHTYLPLTEDDCNEWVNFNLGNGEIGVNVDPLGGNDCLHLFPRKFNRIGDLPQISAGDMWVDADRDGLGDFRPLPVHLSLGPAEPSLAQFRKIAAYRQELPLATAVCRTRHRVSGEYRVAVESWVSWAELHLYCIRLELVPEGRFKGHRKLTITLDLSYRSGRLDSSDRRWTLSAVEGPFRLFEKERTICAVIEEACNQSAIALLAEPRPNSIVIEKDRAALSYEANEPLTVCLFISLTTQKDDEPLFSAIGVVKESSRRGYSACLRQHITAVSRFWSQWDISLPDEFVEEIYAKSVYLCAANVGGYFPPSPMPIADATWYGHIFQDYIPCAEALIRSNHPQKVVKTMDYFFDSLPAARSNATRYGCSGARFSHEMGMDGQETAEEPYRHMHHKTILVPYIIYQYYRATGDRDFLRKKLFPVMVEVCRFLLSFLHAEDFGFTPPSLSIDESALELNYTDPIDLVAGAKWLFRRTLELSKEFGLPLGDREGIEAAEQRLVLPQTERQYLIYENEKPGDRVVEHPAPFYALWPCAVPIDREKMVHTYYDLLTRLTRDQTWNKWIFVGIARLKRPDLLSAFFDGSSPWSIRQGLDKHVITYYERVSNRCCYMLAPHAFVATVVHEMLLQSWNGVIEVFPCVPDIWKMSAISFHDLLAEGAFLVSASRRDARTEWISIRSLRGGPCRVQIPSGLK